MTPAAGISTAMTRMGLLLVALLASACSNGASPEQQRIAALEQENARLHEDLRQAKSNVTRLHSILTHGESDTDDSADVAVGPAIPQGVVPQPENNVSGASAGLE